MVWNHAANVFDSDVPLNGIGLSKTNARTASQHYVVLTRRPQLDRLFAKASLSLTLRVTRISACVVDESMLRRKACALQGSLVTVCENCTKPSADFLKA